MARNKIDYGIDLGTTNSAICRMEQGKPTIIKSDTLKDTMPSCVAFTKKGTIRVGDTAYNMLKQDKCKATETRRESSNSFVEFKRTMGTDKLYIVDSTNEKFSSEELSAEVLKTLKSFVLDENIKSAVITVPAKFTINQKDATMRAAKLAGFEHCELLQEPIAAAMAYGLKAENKNAYWMVFDFGGGTFDAALLNVEDGIIQVFDTEGDNYLGGKDLDYAIVDNILMPYLKENFSIDEILSNDKKKKILRDALKTFAEPAKNQLSFKTEYECTSDLGDMGEDDEGEELELDLTITQDDLKKVFAPLFQKAINICKDLLKRNNLDGSQLSSLILVGGPTHSPILRQMLKEQITTNVDTSVDPMTVVATGAALYASTIDNEVSSDDLEQGTIFFDVKYDATTVEPSTWATVRLDRSKSTGAIPNKIYVDFISSDKSWSSDKVEINEKGDIIECILKEGIVNTFTIETYDEKGNRLKCFPNEISINQGLVVGNATLPYNISIGIWDDDRQTKVTSPITGLERNKQLPAKGVENRYKTSQTLVPGDSNTKLVIPIYQTDEGAEGIKAIYFNEVYRFEITGDDINEVVPENSDLNITISADRSETMSISVYIPCIDFTIDKNFDKEAKHTVSKRELELMIADTQKEIIKLSRKGISIEQYQQELNSIKQDFDNGDEPSKIISDLQKLCRKLDKYDTKGSWEEIERDLDKAMLDLEKANNDLGTAETSMQVESLKRDVMQVKQKRDVKTAKKILDDMRNLYFKLTLVFQLMYMIEDLDRKFSTTAWRDPTIARRLLNQGLSICRTNPTVEDLMPICKELFDLLPSEVVDKYNEGLPH